VDFIPAATRGDQSFGQEQLALMDSIDTILLGSATYRLFAGYWPNVTEGADKSFADKLNAIPKIVFSRTLDTAPWGTWKDARIVKRSAADEVATLKRQSGKDMIVWGSISLAQSLIDDRLVDEYRLVICPVVLGSGRSLFRETAGTIEMKLLNARTLDLGAVRLQYSLGHGQSKAVSRRGV
jgi:dihydrofolate reductase